MVDATLCEECGRREASHTCQICGKYLCSSCLYLGSTQGTCCEACGQGIDTFTAEPGDLFPEGREAP